MDLLQRPCHLPSCRSDRSRKHRTSRVRGMGQPAGRARAGRDRRPDPGPGSRVHRITLAPPSPPLSARGPRTGPDRQLLGMGRHGPPRDRAQRPERGARSPLDPVRGLELQRRLWRALGRQDRHHLGLRDVLSGEGEGHPPVQHECRLPGRRRRARRLVHRQPESLGCRLVDRHESPLPDQDYYRPEGLDGRYPGGDDRAAQGAPQQGQGRGALPCLAEPA